MVQLWKEVATTVGGGSSQDKATAGAVVFIFWAALATLFILTSIMLTCAGGGASKDKPSATQADTNGPSTCAAECGAGCGG
ncbi:hypothetical protein V6N13_142690 [Hibiscus sabdariffa]|uniref:Uncharacterized protein n=1 Tax=Hibiscus sabdariffa TaxID=183260 RepID=A0ABR2FEX5_9ROSI